MFLSSGCWVGVDVAKNHLDIAFSSSGKPFRVPNTPEGFSTFLHHLRSTDVAGIVVESTGFYHRGMTETLADHGFLSSIVNPRQIKDYRNSGLKLAKTDRLDACLLARFGEERHPPTMFPRNVAWQMLKDLVSARNDAVTTKVQWQNRRHNPHLPPAILREMDAAIAGYEAMIARLDVRIAHTIAADPVLAHRDAILQSVPGIALVRSATFLAFLPELGSLPNEVITSLVGVVPHANDSGQRKGYRHTRNGRGAIKGALSLLVMTPRGNPAVLRRRQQFLDRHMTRPNARIAVARWLLAILNTMIAHDLRWEELRMNQPQ